MINLGSAYGEILIGTDKAEGSVKSLAATMRDVGSTMTTTLSLPILGVAAAGLNAAMGFEQSMNQIQVVGGVAADAMGAINAKALQLGAETSFSAGEAAQGMLELAKAGMTTDEVMASIAGTLDLAAAGGLGVAQAAEITANAMNSFSLPAEDATRVANLLAAAANSSSVEVTDMAQAFNMSASVFGSNKVPIDQLAASLAILGNNGIKGSDAGTSMKTMLMRLTAPTKEAAATMAEMGLQVYNADGSMRNFQDILADLGTATAGMTDEQRNMALTTIFGADAIRAANILIKEGAGEFENMMGAVNQTGAATEVANARMKGLAGAIQYIQGTIESLMIGAFQPFLQGMGDMIRGVADLMAKFGELPQPIINAVMAFLGVLGVAGPVIFAIGQIGVVMGALLSPIGLVVLALAGLAALFAGDFGGIRTVTSDLWNYLSVVLDAGAGSIEASEALGLLPGPLQAIVMPVGQVIDGLTNYFAAVQDAGFGSIEAQESIGLFPAVLQPALASLDQTIGAFQNLFTVLADAGPLSIEANEALGLLPDALQPLVRWTLDAWGGLSNFITVVQDAGLTSIEANEALGLLPAGLEEIVSAFVNGWPVVSGAVSAAWETMSGLLGEMATWFQETVPEALATVQDRFAAAWPVVLEAVSAAWEAMSGLLGEMATWFQETVPGVLGTVQDRFAAAWPAVSEAVSAAWGTMSGLLEEMATWFQETLPEVLGTVQERFESVWPALSEAVNTAWGVVGPLLQQIWDWLSVNIPMGLTVLQGWWASVWPVVSEAVNTAWGVVGPLLQQIWGWLSVNIPMGLTVLQGWWASVWPVVSEAVNTAWGVVGPLLSQLWGWLSVNLPVGLAVLQGFATTAWAAIQSAIETAWGAIGPPLQQLWDWLAKLAQNFTALDGPNKAFVLALEGLGAILPVVAGAQGLGLLSVAIGAVSAALGALLSPTMLVAAGAVLLGVAWTNNWVGIRDITATVVEAIKSAWEGLLGLLEPSIERLKTAFGDMTSGLGELGPSFTALQDAVKNVVDALMPIITTLGLVIGGAIGVVATLAVNTLAAVFEALPGVVKAVVDQVTAVINLIAETVDGVVKIVRGLLTGDFAEAWEGVKQIVGGVEEYMKTTLGNLGAVVLLAFGLIRSVIVNTFLDLATAMGLDDLVEKVKGFQTTVTTMVDNLKKTVSGAWLTIKDTIALTVETFSWSTFVTALTWPEAIAGFTWDTWLDVLAWPAVTAIFAWGDWITALEWPDIDSFSWSEFVDGVDLASYIPDFGSWADYIEDAINNFIGGSAVGRSYWPDGAAGVVGERGPELAVMPAGSKILTNGQSNRRLAGDGGMGPVQISIEVGSMNSALDMEELVWRIEQRLKRVASGR